MTLATASAVPFTVEHAPARSIRASRVYSPELDVLRFGAFLMVFCRHAVTELGWIHAAQAAAATQTATGAALHTAHAATSRMAVLQEALQAFDFGVCLFFFLSAFLITRLLLTEATATGTVDVRSFYIRRVLRIWPLYYAFLLTVPVLSLALPELHVSSGRFLAAALFVGNWVAVFHGWQSLAVQPLWSVSVEEQFYAVWPWVARFGRRSIVIFSGALVLIAVGTLLFWHGSEVTNTWPNTLVQGLFLACGALTASLSRPETRRLPGVLRIAMILGGLLAWVAASAGCHVVRTVSPRPGSLLAGYALVLLGTFLIFTGVAGWNRRPIPETLLKLGRMSYGLYVFHAGILLVVCRELLGLGNRHGLSPYLSIGVGSLLSLALTTILAALSYRYLETPFLRWKDRFAVVLSRPI